MNLKQLMMNNREALIAAFIVLVVVGLVFAVIIPRMREDSILGHAKPATQKLMVIDQDSGAISFVNKSLQGINNDFTTRDGNVLTAMKMLLGENLNNFGGYETQYNKNGNPNTLGIIGMLTRDQQALDTRVVPCEGAVEDIKLFKKGNGMDTLRVILDSAVRYNDKIALGETANSYPIVGFKKSNSDGSWATYDHDNPGFNTIRVELHDAHTSNMRIVKGSQVPGQ